MIGKDGALRNRQIGGGLGCDELLWWWDLHNKRIGRGVGCETLETQGGV